MVRIELKLLRSKLGRRLLLLFGATALIPLTVLGTLSMIETRRQIVDQEREDLRRETKSIGMGLLARLERFDADLLLVADNAFLDANSREAAASGHLQQWVEQRFVSLSWIDGVGRVKTIAGDRPSPEVVETVLERTQSSEARDAPIALHALPDLPTQSRVLVTRRAGGGFMLGEVEPTALWDFTLPESLSLCAVGADGSSLYCPGDTPGNLIDHVLAAAGEQSTGYFDWEGTGDQANVHFWTLPPGGRYFEQPVTFILSSRSSAAGTRLRAFQQVYVLTAVASLIAIVLVSIRQIRRYTTPLQKLREGAVRVGQRDFSKPVDVTSNDEFQEVASAFNGMTGRVQGLLGTLRTLAAIDRVILSAPDRASMIESLLTELPAVIPCQCVGFGLLVEGLDGPVALRSRRTLGEAVEVSTENAISTAMRDTLDQGAPTWLELHSLRMHGLDTLIEADTRRGLLVPIAYRPGAAAYLAWTFRAEDSESDFDLSVATDLAERAAVALKNAEHEEDMYRRANYDSLTGLPNRELLRTRLERAMEAGKDSGQSLGLMFVDLDRFKSINDTLGHARGDELLVTLAQRLQSVARAPSFVARFGGDEFIVVAPELGHQPDRALSKLADDVLAATVKPVSLAGVPHRVTTSIGVALYPQDGTTAEELMMNADAAMYEAKAAGRDTARRYQEQMGAVVRERHQIENGLRTAVEDDELKVLFQPKVELATGQVTGAEALIRWNSSRLGHVMPDRFIEIAEESDLILGIGEWILRRSCEFAASRQGKRKPPFTVAVNASARQLSDDGFVRTVRRVLAETGLPAHALQIEVTESAVMNDIDNVAAVLEGLAALGVGVAIDDFGTGYSSLSYLAELPIQTLKIDQSFTRRMIDNSRIESIVNAILDLARNLELAVVAEGIESEREFEILAQRGCDYGQGYHFGKPMTAKELEELLGASSASVGGSGSFARSAVQFSKL